MHKCKNCGNEFEGKFCPECGTKFVAEDVCPKCGAKLVPEAKFCSECGAALNCGKPQRSAGTAIGEKVKFWIGLSGIICILLSALMGLVFAFVCGVALKSDGKIVETSMLYDYFGNEYKDIDEIRKTILTGFGWRNMGGAREFALYFPVVLGTVISAVGLLGVVALSALTAFKVYKKYYKKQEANIVAPAAATYLTFAALATLLRLLSAADTSESKVVFSTPTLAGLITGGVLLGLGLLLVAGSGYKNFKGFDKTVASVAAVAVSALTVVIVALLALPAGGTKITTYIFNGYYPQLITTKAHMGLFTGVQSSLLTIEEDEKIFELVAYSTVGGVAAISLAVVSAVTLFRKISVVCEGKNKSNIVLGAVAVGLAVIYLTFTILFINSMFEESTAKVEKDFAVTISILVMAVLAFGAELAGKFIRKGEEKVQVDASAETPEEIPAQEE